MYACIQKAVLASIMVLGSSLSAMATCEIQVSDNYMMSRSEYLPAFWVICDSSHASGWTVLAGRCRIIKPNATQYNHEPCTFDGIDQYSYGLPMPSPTLDVGIWTYEFWTKETDGMTTDWFLRDTVYITVTN